MRYCPVCLNNTLNIAISGVVEIFIDGKPKDNTKILFKIDKKKEFAINLEKKMDFFLKWLTTFQHLKSKKTVRVTSHAFCCQNNCHIPLHIQYSVIDHLISRQDFILMLKIFEKKYSMELIQEKD